MSQTQMTESGSEGTIPSHSTSRAPSTRGGRAQSLRSIMSRTPHSSVPHDPSRSPSTRRQSLKSLITRSPSKSPARGPPQFLETDEAVPSSGSHLSSGNRNQSPDHEQHGQTTFLPPRSVLFILGTQFGERFSFYGLREILRDYLMDNRNLTINKVKVTLDAFLVFCYTFVVIGAYVGDTFLGKFRGIVFSAIVYLVGCVCLAMGNTFILPIETLLVLVIAIGAGTMKPCMPTLGGDQYDKDFKPLRSFFFWFYLVTNLAALAGMYISPLLAETFGFWVPVVTMGLTLVIFIAGKILTTYKVSAPRDIDSLLFIPLICDALKKKRKSRAKKEHWLDYATHKYGEQLVGDVKQVIHVLVRFIPMPIFWAIYYEQWGAHMVWLTSHMNCFYGERLVEDPRKDFAIINPISVIAFVLIFKYLIYPCFGLVRLLRGPLQRAVVGCMLASIAYIIAGEVATNAVSNERTNGRDAVFDTENGGSHFFYNNVGCELTLIANFSNYNKTPGKFLASYNISDKGVLKVYNIKPHKDATAEKLEMIQYEQYSSCSPNYTYFTGVPNIYIYVHEVRLIVYLYSRWLIAKQVDVHRQERGYPMIRAVAERSDTMGVTNFAIEFYHRGKLELLTTEFLNTSEGAEVHLPHPGIYTIKEHGTEVVSEYEFKARSYYVVTIRIDVAKGQYVPMIWELNSNDRIECLTLWLPVSIVLAAAEVMVVISSMEFAYTQAPDTMKCFVMACWLLTVPIGILFESIINRIVRNEEISTIFHVYAGLTIFNGAALAVLSWFYKYV